MINKNFWGVSTKWVEANSKSLFQHENKSQRRTPVKELLQMFCSLFWQSLQRISYSRASFRTTPANPQTCANSIRGYRMQRWQNKLQYCCFYYCHSSTHAQTLFDTNKSRGSYIMDRKSFSTVTTQNKETENDPFLQKLQIVDVKSCCQVTAEIQNSRPSSMQRPHDNPYLDQDALEKR